MNDLDSGSFGTNDSKAVLMGRVWLFRYSDDIEVIDGLMETIKGRGRDVIPAPARGGRGKRFRHTSGTVTSVHTTIRSMVGSELDGFSIGHEDDHV